MKKVTLWFAIAALLFALNPTLLKGESNAELHAFEPAKTEMGVITPLETHKAILATPQAEMAMASSAEEAHASAQLQRLNEIKEMDLSALSSTERNELRKEVRAIEKEQRPSGGIYISVGAAILIVLLLILLL